MRTTKPGQLQLPLRADAAIPVIVSYGAGVDSTAMLCAMVRRGDRVDRILFADTGGEKQETYDYIPYFNDFLKRHGFPEIEKVTNVPKNFKNWPPYYSLEDNCLTNGTLPSLAFGFKSCSEKWKIAPQNRLIREWNRAQEVWKDGEKLIKLIGYDASPADIRRRNHLGDVFDREYSFRYPLIEWGWDRAECIRQIAGMGLQVPPKSSCFFCPAMKPAEVAQLPAEKLERIVVMEARALPRLEKVRGLWREGLSRKRSVECGHEKIENMTDFIRKEGLLDSDRIEELQTTVPPAIIEYQEGYAKALEAGTAEHYLQRAVQDCRHVA